MTMTDTERVYTIPLGIVKCVPVYRRSNRAMTEIRNYLARHMKVPAEDVKIDPGLNQVIWRRGAGKPPRRVRYGRLNSKTAEWKQSLPVRDKRTKIAGSSLLGSSPAAQMIWCFCRQMLEKRIWQQ